ncbi:MAG: hypothetical protein ACLFTT_17695 [Candidatus Hydrogenedentota bacterium]
MLDQIPPQNRHLLLSREIPARAFHVLAPNWLGLAYTLATPIPTEARQQLLGQNILDVFSEHKISRVAGEIPEVVKTVIL